MYTNKWIKLAQNVTWCALVLLVLHIRNGKRIVINMAAELQKE